MNKFQLQCIPTNELNLLRGNIDNELNARRKAKAVEKRLIEIGSMATTANGHIRKINAEVELNNSLRPLLIPGLATQKYLALLPYLKPLINQDWSHIFFGMDSNPIYYVYAHIDPRKKSFSVDDVCGGRFDGEPFYIGKGSGNRAFDLKRNQGHGKLIKSILDDGFPTSSLVRIVFNGLTESKAFELESKLILFFGTIYQANRKQGILYNLEIPPTPEFHGLMEKHFTKKYAPDGGLHKVRRVGLPPSETAHIDPSGARRLVRESDLCVRPLKGLA